MDACKMGREQKNRGGWWGKYGNRLNSAENSMEMLASQATNNDTPNSKGTAAVNSVK